MTAADNSPTELVSFTLRFTKELLAEIDKRAAQTKRSRNEWCVRALGYVLAELPTGATPAQRLALRARWERGEL